MVKRSDRYKLFCKEYIIDLNGTRAALAAGYSKKSPAKAASQLLTRGKIQAELTRLLAKREKGLDYSADRILAELTKLGFSNMLDFLTPTENGEDLNFDFSKLTREQGAAIQEYTVDSTGGTGDGERKKVMRTRFKLADKIRALELLGKYRKLFIEKVEISGDTDILAALSAGRERARSRQPGGEQDTRRD